METISVYKNKMFNQLKRKGEKEMAKNWTVAEAMKELLKGNEEVFQIGKSYPRVLAALSAVKGSGVDAAVNIITHLPDDVTVRKLNDCLSSEGVEDDEDEDDAPVTKKEKVSDEDDKKAKAKARREARKAKAAAAKTKDEDDEEEDDEDQQDYSSMSALELYQLCKKRGLKPEQKKKESVYIKMLKEADAAAEEEDDDDWGDDEEEEVAPAKTKKTQKVKKAAKEEEDDDEWDI